MNCNQCKKTKLKLKLWQTSLNKYINFCGEDCMKKYLMNKYKRSQHAKVIGLSLELAEGI